MYSIDLIRSLKYCYESRELEYGEDKIKNLASVYSGKEKLFKAKEIMENWKQNSNEDIRKLSSDFLQGVDDLMFAFNLLERLFKEGTVGDWESELALSKVKIEEGREKLFGSSLDLGPIISSQKRHGTEHKPIRFNLSKQQLDYIVQYINDNFEELKDYEKKKEEKSKVFELPQEMWGVILIKGFIEKNR